MFFFLCNVKNEDVILFKQTTGFMQSKHFCIISHNKIPSRAKTKLIYPIQQVPVSFPNEGKRIHWLQRANAERKFQD